MSEVTKNKPDRLPRILVAGDAVREIRVFRGSRDLPSDFLSPGTHQTTSIGNAVFLARLLESAFAVDASRAAQKTAQVVLGLDEGGLASLPSFLTSHEVWRPFPAAGGAVWRLAEKLGYGWKPKDATADGAYSKLVNADALAAPSDIVVLDDAGLLYRLAPQRAGWPLFLATPTAASDRLPRWIVLKTTSPLAAGDLWRALEPHRDRLVIVLDIEDLRREEARITQGASWERTALDLVRELQDNPSLNPLLGCRHLVLRIGLEGAFVATSTRGRIDRAQLFFDPDLMEGDFTLREKIDGEVFGATSALVTGVVRHLAVDADAQNLQSGVRAGIAAARHLLKTGLGPVDRDPPPSWDFAGLRAQLQPADQKSGLFLAGVNVPLANAAADTWTIIAANHATAQTRGPLFGVAAKLALAGPDFLVDAPKQRFGKVMTVDRAEIESLRGVRDLMREYAASGEQKPLSIGVFGPPGAGKSFAVKEIARGVFGEKVPLLEFNLSQFAGPADLIGALHQVRDIAIEGRIPVVFWDEFDSRGYFWLQYQLAPMQDGKFLEGQITHPIGRAVFVFAGGTSKDFAGFGPPEEESAEARKAKQEWKLLKGPDFKSRLAGYLNILGPNPRRKGCGPAEAVDPTDICFPIRRALLLRALFGAKDKQILEIDRGLLGALLEIKEYKHGSRSVEKIANLLVQHGKRGALRRSDLPTAEIVSIHAELAEIEELSRRDFSFRCQASTLAPAFHLYYRELCKREGWAFKYDVDYAELPDEIKSDNEAAAHRLPFILRLAPLWVVPAGPAALAAERAREILSAHVEILSEAEHDGWMEHKLRNGWRLGARDDASRVHDLLVPYRRLSEKEKDKDRQNVLHYPEIVALAGYGLADKAPT